MRARLDDGHAKTFVDGRRDDDIELAIDRRLVGDEAWPAHAAREAEGRDAFFDAPVDAADDAQPERAGWQAGQRLEQHAVAFLGAKPADDAQSGGTRRG